jgi:signal transduction histidine kinase
MAEEPHSSLNSGRDTNRSLHIETLWSPWRITGLFLAVSLLWILGTDWLLLTLVDNDRLAREIQTWKGLAWVLLLAALIYMQLSRTRKLQRRLYDEIRQQQALLETRVQERTTRLLDSREQLRMLTRRLDRLAEIERKSISRELHDQMGSDLTSLKIDLQAIENSIPSRDADSAARVATALALVDSMYLSFRQIASRLRPSVLDDCGLAAGIEWLADEFEKRADCSCIIEVADVDVPPDELRDTALFRICQESLTNVLKHAKADNVTISLAATGDRIELVVEDDGVGTDSDVDTSQQRLGVIGMEERAFAVGGETTVDAAPNGGTRVRVVVPYHSEAPGGPA